VGLQAGLVGQGANTIAIGSYSGQTGQNTFAIAIGDVAGQSGQYSSAISIGTNAGQLNQRANAITIGSLSGQTGQNTFAIAIGDVAGQSGQFLSAIAIGQGAGQLNQRANAITIGAFSGQSGQNAYAISMGDLAGQRGQYESAVAIGRGAGQSAQGSSAVAVGYLAGQSAQGNNSIAIGNQAGSSTAGSIMLNASGSAKNTAVAGFHVFPVRYSTAASNVITYNSSTGEIGDSGMTTLASTLKFSGAYIYSNSSANPTRTSSNFGFYTNGTTETVINSGASGYINFKFNDVRRMFLGPAGDLVVAGGGGSCLGLGDRDVTTSIWTLYASGGASSVFKIYYNSADRFFLDGSGNLTTTGYHSNGTIYMRGNRITAYNADDNNFAIYVDGTNTTISAPVNAIYFKITNAEKGYLNTNELWINTRIRTYHFYAEDYISVANGFRMYSNQLQRGTGAANDFGNVAIYWGDSNLNLYARANAVIYLRINNAERFWTNNTESYAYGQMRSAYIRSDGGIYAAGMYETWGGSAGYLIGSRNNYYSYQLYSQWGQLFIYSYEANTESHRFLHYGGAARRDSYSYWDAWSDSNMKTDIIDANLDMCYENIKNMNLKKFRYKDEIESIDKTDKYRLGFIAQDLQKIFPKSVRDNTIKEGKFLSLNLDQLNYTLYGAVQKIMKNMDTKDSQISSLETQLSITDSRVSDTLTHLSNTNTQLVQTSSQLASTQTQLAETRTQLASTQTQLTSTQSQLTETNSNLASTQSQLSETRTQLSSTQSQLTITKNELSSVKSQLSSTQSQLSETKQDLSQTQSQLTETKQELSQTQSQLTETKQELTDLKNSTKRGSVALFNGAATVSLVDISTLGANPQLFLQPRMSFDRVIGEIDGTQIHITCEKIQSTATIDWLIVSG
jgi:peptidoglycan hydrolase CwlO-like protein